MSRLFDIGIKVLAWENNHLRQINACIDHGCPPGEIDDLRKALGDVIKQADDELPKRGIEVLTSIELRGALHL